MPTFIPPTFDDRPMYTPDSPTEKLFKYYPSHQTGYVVWKDRDGVWHQDTVATTAIGHSGITTGTGSRSPARTRASATPRSCTWVATYTSSLRPQQPN